MKCVCFFFKIFSIHTDISIIVFALTHPYTTPLLADREPVDEKHLIKGKCVFIFKMREWGRIMNFERIYRGG